MATSNTHQNIFGVVKAQINLSALADFPESEDVLMKFWRKNLSVHRYENDFSIEGSFDQVTEFHNELNKLVPGIRCIIAGSINEESKVFLLKVFSSQESSGESKITLINKTYDIISFCLAIVKLGHKIKSMFKDVTLTRKPTADAGKIKISYKGKNKLEIEKLCNQMKQLCDEQRLPFVAESYNGSIGYITSVVAQMKEKFNPSIIIVDNFMLYASVHESVMISCKEFLLQYNPQLYLDQKILTLKELLCTMCQHTFRDKMVCDEIAVRRPAHQQSISNPQGIDGNTGEDPPKDSHSSQQANTRSLHETSNSTSPADNMPCTSFGARPKYPASGEDLQDISSNRSTDTSKSSRSSGHKKSKKTVQSEPMDFGVPCHTRKSEEDEVLMPSVKTLEVGHGAPEYIRLFHGETMTAFQAQYGVLIEGSTSDEGKLTVTSYKEPLSEKAMDDIAEKIQEFVLCIATISIEIAKWDTLTDKLVKKYREKGIQEGVLVTHQGHRIMCILGPEKEANRMFKLIEFELELENHKPRRKRVLIKPKSPEEPKLSFEAVSLDSASSTSTPTVATYNPSTAAISSSSAAAMSSSSAAVMSSSSAASTSSSSTLTKTCYYHLSASVTVVVAFSDITQLSVDVIANAANEDLQHVGGVAWAIAKAGGDVIQQECDRYIRKKKKLDISDTFVTTAGQLPCKKVIHVVGPQWKDYSSDRDCIHDLKTTFKNVLKEAAKLKVRSLGIPAISSGIYGVPKDLVAHAACSAICSYLKKAAGKTTLQDIHLVDIERDTVSRINTQMEGLVNQKVFLRSSDVILEGERSVGEVDKPNSLQASHYDSRLRGNKQESSSGPSSGDVTKITPSHGLPVDKNIPQQGATRNKKASEELEDCCICMCPPTNPKTLPKCKHTFCSECIDRGFKVKPICPICGEIYGEIMGDQPKNGEMNIRRDHGRRLDGYRDCGAIVIEYSFPPGIQSKDMCNPGQPYSGTHRTAYLPDNAEGNKVVSLLKKAFKARLIFTVGTSRTSGQENTVTWNDIHHKTNTYGGPQKFGYPDPTYLSRVTEELASKGIK